MTSSTNDASPGLKDVARQATIAIGAVVAIAGSAWGVGAFGGTPIEEAGDGVFAPDASLLTPASSAFSIWSLIYLGLIAFAIYQALPAHGSHPRLRAAGWWVLASMVLNALWIAVVQAGWLWISVAVLALLVAVLTRLTVILARSRTRTMVETVVLDGTIGVYLGWATVATVANVTAVLTTQFPSSLPQHGTLPAIGALAAVALLAVLIARKVRAAPVLLTSACMAMAWGLAWTAVARTDGAAESLGVVWAAGLAAIVAFATPFAVLDFTRRERSS